MSKNIRLELIFVIAIILAAVLLGDTFFHFRFSICGPSSLCRAFFFSIMVNFIGLLTPIIATLSFFYLKSSMSKSKKVIMTMLLPVPFIYVAIFIIEAVIIANTID